jgi:hypothetical protein
MEKQGDNRVAAITVARVSAIGCDATVKKQSARNIVDGDLARNTCLEACGLDTSWVIENMHARNPNGGGS